MNQYPLWKNLLVFIVVLLGGFFALPNLFDQDPSMEISAQRDAVIDQTTESRVQQALETVMKQRTTIVIAHRLSTVIHADHIVVLDYGRKISDGTPDTVRNDPAVVSAYLGEDEADEAMPGEGD